MMNDERNDLLTLLKCQAVVLAVWIIVFGWRAGMLAFSGDAWTFWMPYLVNHLETGGNDLISYSWMGGSPLRLTDGTPLSFHIGRILGLSPAGIINLTGFVAQGMIAFFSVQAVQSIIRFKDKDHNVPLNPLIILCTVVAGFAPVLAWRVSAGHLNILLALSAYCAGIMLLSQAAVNQIRIVPTLLSVWAFMEGLLTSGQQILVYSALFGLPVVAWIIYSGWDKRLPVRDGLRLQIKRYAIPVGALVAAILIVLPDQFAKIHYAFSSDSGRSIQSGAEVAFSYTTQTARDWWYSIVYRLDLLSYRDTIYWHETNYPVGPFILIVAGIFIKKERLLGLACLSSGVVAIVFSMRVQPVTDTLLTAIPILGAFRVPARAILPVMMVLPIFTLVWFFRSHRVFTWGRLLVGMVVFALAYIVTPVVRDYLAVAAACSVALSILVTDRYLFTYRRWIELACFLFLCGSAFAAFHDRLLPMKGVAEIHSYGAMLKTPFSTSESSLDRVYSELSAVRLSTNSLEYLQLPSTKGSGHPPKRFIELFEVWFEKGHMPVRMTFTFKLSDPKSLQWCRLYNIQQVLIPGKNRTLVVKKPAGDLRPAWFSQGIVTCENLEQMVTQLENTSFVPSNAQLINSDDTIFQVLDINSLRLNQPQLESPYPGTLTVQAREGEPVIVELSHALEVARPLTLSLNYFEIFQARAMLTDGTAVDVVPYPAYHALTGLVLPKGTKRVVLAPVIDVPPYVQVMPWLGGCLLILCIACLVKQERSQHRKSAVNDDPTPLKESDNQES